MALRIMQQMEDEGLDLVPTLVLSRRQREGRGRADRSWSSPRGGLYLNWIRSGLSPDVIPRLPMLAAASALTAVTALAIDGVAIKWPNDLLVGGAKLAGILVHARSGDPTWTTVGLGANLISAPSLDESADRPATCIADHREVRDWAELAAALAVAFVNALATALDDPEPALEVWRCGLLHTPGDTMTVRLGSGEVVTGTYLGLTDDGFLRLDGPEGETVITSGDVFDSLKR
jgi:BirA family biotin operon repressor/biotin-[acetyl-CoA-carboxylase] ligase